MNTAASVGHAPRSTWWCALTLIAVMAALQALPYEWRIALRYEPEALRQGQFWRAISAHFLHLSWNHAALNACGLLLCCALADASWTPVRLVQRLVFLAVGVSILLFSFSPQVPNYVGLSGVLYGLIFWILVPAALRRDSMAAAVLAMVLAWMLWQWWFGPDAREQALIGGSIIVQAHAYGIFSAVLALLFGFWRQR